MDIHTKGKLKLSPGTHMLTEDGIAIGQVSCHYEKPVWEANARRIVACWNAMEGIGSDNAIFMKGNNVRRVLATIEMERINLESQRNSLLDALESALKTAEFENHPFRPWHDQARAAIKSVKGGK